MTDFWCERHDSALLPADDASYDILTSLPRGRALHVTVKQPRNIGHHRLYWALCQRIASAKGINAENVSDILKIATGHCTVVRTKSYGEVRLPKSISFAAMDQTAFREFFERCVLTVYEEWKIEPGMISDLLVPQESALIR